MIKKKENINESIKTLLNVESSRRDFLKWIGYSTASVTLSSCKGPVIKSIPYIVKPEEITPGVPTYYASTMMDAFDMSSVLVKTREGRPIKIEPNLLSKNWNTTSARIQSSLLLLYNEEKFKHPYINGKKTNWKKVDNYIIKQLNILNKRKKEIVFLSHSLPSFTTKKLFKDFQKVYPYSKWIVYDSISYSNALDASKKVFDIRAFPSFDLQDIELIISFDADFLGDWSPENMGKNYVKNKTPEKSMIRHIQIESNMTITGANSDIRIVKKPSYIKKMLIELYNSIFFNVNTEDQEVNKILSLIKEKKSKSVIFADGDQESYEISFLINKKINSNSLKHDNFIFLKESNDLECKEFINSLKEGKIGGIFLNDINPVYSLPLSMDIKKYLKNIPLNVSFSITKNETNQYSKIIAPIPHWLESWGDTHPSSNYYTLMQPAIQQIFDTRQMQDSLIIWGKMNIKNYYEYLKKNWTKYIIPNSNVSSFNQALFYGFLLKNKSKKKDNKKDKKNNNQQYILHKKNNKNNNAFELKLYTKISMGDGYQWNNPWLQELPDPITRTTWENYLTISFFDAKRKNIKNWQTTDGSLHGNCVNLFLDRKLIFRNIPVLIQPGQAEGCIGLAFGYGQKIGKLSHVCSGFNAYKIYENFCIVQKNIEIEKTKKEYQFSCIQLQNDLIGRNIVKEVNLKHFLTNRKEICNENEEHQDLLNELKKLSIWGEKKEKKTGHHFNLSIDLNACIGCGSCIISCHSENNVPIVGKEEITKSRDMHWVRVDRYYSVNHNKKKNLKEIDSFYRNPKVSFQPIMCQHCEYAPCETVCPVGATSHSKQGQNMMTYNRCIGTRYCANNCPYKVRRFNWFNYSNNKKFDFNMNNSLGKMVLNPDVVIRTRGVMEKCSLCIQRTQYTIVNAKKENRKVEDHEFETACSISCPTKAITFGDINDKSSEIYGKINDKRSYKLLDFLGIKPNVSYLIKVRNNDE
ncbi:4Fe-4S dicluster domain-containing protein [Blattabacterium cuenoti]|nr:4Fe-4S dicluster domain-containing protein [Blattabacterium cuenoti]